MTGPAMRKRTYFIGLVLSLFFLALFLRKIDVREMGEIFKKVNYLYTLPLMGLNLFALWVRARRWGLLLRPIQPIPSWTLFRVTAIGFMANNILPARIGEVVRAVLLADRARISKTASLATVVVERLFDGFTVLFLFALVLLIMPFPPERTGGFTLEAMKSFGVFSFVLYSFVFVILLLLRFQNRRSLALLRFFLGRLPENWSRVLHRHVESFIAGLEVLKDGSKILMVILYSFFLWSVLAATPYLLFYGFHLPLSFWTAVFIEVVLVFGVTLPSAPGFIGTFHWICAAALIFLGIEANLAKGFALILWLCGFVPVTALGLMLLWIEGLSLQVLKRAEAERE